MRKKEYRRWDYDDETDMSMMEEQLTLEDNQFDCDHNERDTPTNNTNSSSATNTTTTTFSQSSLTLTGSHILRKKMYRRLKIKEKVQVLCLSVAILLLGFIAGFQVGVRDFATRNRINSTITLSSTSAIKDPPLQSSPSHLTSSSKDSSSGGDIHSTNPSSSSLSSSSSSQENENGGELSLEPHSPTDISTDNILQILKKVSSKVHGAGTPEGKSMALVIRDLWRSYGLSVRVEQHKTLLTKVTGLSYVEVLDRNGSVAFRTSSENGGEELPSAQYTRPMIAFSPAADLNGTLIYARYGRKEDLDFLLTSRIVLKGSIALVRFGGPHPSQVASIASAYGIKGLLFYLDPQDYGPRLRLSAIRSSSLLTLGQIHEYQKHKGKSILPAHTISASDAEQLFRLTRQGNWMKRAPSAWQGGLKTPYFLGPTIPTFSSNEYGGSRGGGDSEDIVAIPPLLPIRLKVSNEPKMSTIFNVVAAIPGAWESDRYVIIGCPHDSWGYGAGEPGFGIALLSELARTFSTSVQKGWKPRRSILFISWDANLFASSGVSHWLQEHHFEISSRTIAYIDLSRSLRGNESLHIHSSPILNSVARKAISRVLHESSSGQFNPPPPTTSSPEKSNGSLPIYFSSLVTSDEPSFVFLGNLGIPFMRLCMSNSPKGYDYPHFHTSFDTYDNFLDFLNPGAMEGGETLGKIILETIVLLADSSVLPINVEDYVVEIQKAFGNFMAHYQEDLHKANLSIAYLQAAVMRLEVIGDNFRTEMHNRTVINPEYDSLPVPSPSPKTIKSKRALLHRIINDKLMEIDRTLLYRNSDIYKHQVLGFTSNMEEISMSHTDDPTNDTSPTSLLLGTSLDHYFPKLKEALDCGRKEQEQLYLTQQRLKKKLEEEEEVEEEEEEQGDGSEDDYDDGGDDSFRARGYPSKRETSKSSRKFKLTNNRSFKRMRTRPSTLTTTATTTPIPPPLDPAFFTDPSSPCSDWHFLAAQRIASLTRALDATSAVLQSPLLPEESE